MKTKSKRDGITAGQPVTLWDDISAEASYVLMRFLRLVSFLALELVTLFCLIRALFCIFAALDSTMDLWMLKPGLMYLVGAITAGVLCWACGTPYRYNTKMPGIVVKTCCRCKARMEDKWFCPRCGELRPGGVINSLLWLLSLLLTVVFVIHDLAWVLLTAASFRKKD